MTEHVSVSTVYGSGLTMLSEIFTHKDFQKGLMKTYTLCIPNQNFKILLTGFFMNDIPTFVK